MSHPIQPLTHEREEWDRRVAEIRARYDLIKTHPPDPFAITAYAREFWKLGDKPKEPS